MKRKLLLAIPLALLVMSGCQKEPNPERVVDTAPQEMPYYEVELTHYEDNSRVSVYRENKEIEELMNAMVMSQLVYGEKPTKKEPVLKLHFYSDVSPKKDMVYYVIEDGDNFYITGDEEWTDLAKMTEPGVQKLSWYLEN